VTRTHTGWKYVALFLVVFHFFIPFLLLLWRRTKRNPRALGTLAAIIVALRLVDLLWVVAPSFAWEGVPHHGGQQVAKAAAEGHHEVVHVALGWWHAWMYPAAAAAIGGVFVFAFLRQLKRRPLLPLHDPRLAAAPGGDH
jgi:hypothetical protein